MGLPAAQFPPLAGSEWVTGPEERLIKLTLHGLYGPIEVKGEKFPGVVPMTPFKMLSDQEVAEVLSFCAQHLWQQGPDGDRGNGQEGAGRNSIAG